LLVLSRQIALNSWHYMPPHIYNLSVIKLVHLFSHIICINRYISILSRDKLNYLTALFCPDSPMKILKKITF